MTGNSDALRTNCWVVTSMRLTTREIDVLRLLSRGLRYADIALHLGITRNTTAGHLKNAYRKLEVRSGPAAVMRAVELRLLGEA